MFYERAAVRDTALRVPTSPSRAHHTPQVEKELYLYFTAASHCMISDRHDNSVPCTTARISRTAHAADIFQQFTSARMKRRCRHLRHTSSDRPCVTAASWRTRSRGQGRAAVWGRECCCCCCWQRGRRYLNCRRHDTHRLYRRRYVCCCRPIPAARKRSRRGCHRAVAFAVRQAREVPWSMVAHVLFRSQQLPRSTTAPSALAVPAAAAHRQRSPCRHHHGKHRNQQFSP